MTSHHRWFQFKPARCEFQAPNSKSKNAAFWVWGLITIIVPYYINQSINQSNFYNANISGKARLSGATAKSVFNSKIEETTP